MATANSHALTGLCIVLVNDSFPKLQALSSARLDTPPHHDRCAACPAGALIDQLKATAARHHVLDPFSLNRTVGGGDRDQRVGRGAGDPLYRAVFERGSGKILFIIIWRLDQNAATALDRGGPQHDPLREDR